MIFCKKSNSSSNSIINNIHFSKEQCDTLYEAILIDDDITLNAKLPDKIIFNYTQEQITENLAICYQLWDEGIHEPGFNSILDTLCQGRMLSETEKALFKKVRAKFKHLRCGFRLFDQRHQTPFMIGKLTSLMGVLQDAFKNNHIYLVKFYAKALKLVWTTSLFSYIEKEASHLLPCNIEDFYKTIRKLVANANNLSKQQKITPHDFHVIRKQISLITAIYTNFMVLYPSEYHKQIFVYMATINGMMGDYHDKLIQNKLKKTQDYFFDHIHIPEEILTRLNVFIENFQRSF